MLQTAAPISAPWNARNRLALTTPDGSGATIHPSVVDMGTSWNGYRYWMANTPYAAADNQLENPAIWASNNRLGWVVPAGVANPLVAPPGASVGFHSDTELVWDPDDSRLLMFFRTAWFTGTPVVVTSIELRATTSTDGTTWSAPVKVADLPLTGGRLSPAVVRTGANQWRMWLWGGDLTGTTRTASNPLGTWGAPASLTLNGADLLGWHGDVIRVGSTYYMAYSANELDQMKVATSANGIAWTAPAVPTVVTRSTTRWDRSVYRPTLCNGPESGFISVWYSAVSAPSPGGHAIGFTRIPISAWT